MTLDAEDIELIRGLILECLSVERQPQQPSRMDQIKAMAKDPELARQIFKQNRKPAQRRKSAP